jgi:DNA-binding CsgD family transcriptional regulator
MLDLKAAKWFPRSIFQQNEFHLQINGEYIAISKRESQCLALLSQGKTAKEIAKKLDISHRTIETYYDKMREKTHSNTRMELLGKIENKLALKELILNEII